MSTIIFAVGFNQLLISPDGVNKDLLDVQAAPMRETGMNGACVMW